MTIRVVLADDHPMYRYGLTAILEQAEAIDVIASVGDGAALVSAVGEFSPDVVLTDLSMPRFDGVAAITQLLETQPELPILVLTMHEDDEHVFAALRAGARGYLVKGSDGEEIVRAVHSVASGEAVYGGTVARRIVAFYSGRQVESPTARAFPDLTPASARCWSCWPPAAATTKSPAAWACPRRPSATTSPRSSPNSRSPTARPPPSRQRNPASAILQPAFANAHCAGCAMSHGRRR